MGQLLVRQFDDDLKHRLKRRAAQNGVSMEQEARTILRSALLEDAEEYGLGTRIAALFRDIQGNDEPWPELPRKPWRPMTFEE